MQWNDLRMLLDDFADCNLILLYASVHISADGLTRMQTQHNGFGASGTRPCLIRCTCGDVKDLGGMASKCYLWL